MLRDVRTIQRFYDRIEVWAEELDWVSREAPEDATTLMRYILTVVGEEAYEQVSQRIVEVVPTTEVSMATAAERLIQQGFLQGEARGKAEGEARGKAEGEARGKANGVLTVLEARGLTVTPAQRASVLGCRDLAELDRWLRAAVTVTSVDELFARVE